MLVLAFKPEETHPDAHTLSGDTKVINSRYLVEIGVITELTTRKREERRKPAVEEIMAAACGGSVLLGSEFVQRASAGV